MDTRDDLGYHDQPRVYADVAESLPQRRLDLLRGTMVEPQREQSENILERAIPVMLGACAAQCDGGKESGDSWRNVSDIKEINQSKDTGGHQFLMYKPLALSMVKHINYDKSWY